MTRPLAMPSPPPAPDVIALPVVLPVASSTAGGSDQVSASSPPLRAGNTPRVPSAWSASERTGRQDLERVRESLSERDEAVLQAVADHRFLTTRQVELLVFTTHATALSAARTCRRVLRRLAGLRVLRHLERRVGGVRAGSASFVWALGPVGDRLAREHRSERARGRSHEPSQRFLAHTLAIADAHVRLVQAAHGGQLDLVTVQTEPQCWRRYTGGHGALSVLQPDLYVVTGAGEYEDCAFLEIDLGNEHLPTLLSKCQQYQSYRASGAEQRDGGVFPVVVWVMSTLDRVQRLRAALASTPGIESDLFQVTKPDHLVALLAGGAA